MGKVRRLTTKSLLVTLIAVVAMTLAAYLGAFESLGAWARQREPGQLGAFLAVSIVFTAALGFYGWRGWARLRQQTTRHEREFAKLRHTREALQRDAATYRGVIANLPVALFAVDPEGVFTLTEGTGLDLLGLEPDRVVGQSIFKTYRDSPQVVESVRLALGGQASGAIVEVGGRAFETRYSPLREHNQFSGVLGVATDVTEHRRAENRLREAEARYRTLVEQIPAITYVEQLSNSGKVLAYMSPQYEAMFGYSPEVGNSHPKHWLNVVHPEDRERVLEEDKRTDESLEPFRAEYRVIAKDGRVVWVRDEAVLVRNERGEPLFWQGVMHDITKRKKAEEKLREAEERYRTLVEQIPAIVYIDTLEGLGYGGYTSPQAEALLGYPISAWDADPLLWTKLVHPDDREWVLAENERANTEGVPLTLEYRMISEDDRVVWLRDESVVLRDGDGRPWRRQGIMHDVTERVGAEEALRESERRLSTLLANAPAYLYRCRNEPGWPNEFVSDYAEELTGHSPDELTDGSVMFGDLIVDEDRQRVWDEVQEALAKHQRIVLRYAIRRKDGQIRHVEEHGQGIYGEDGGVEAIEGVVYDVTERVQAEEALRDAEERYRTLVEQMPAVTYIDLADGSDEPLYTSPQIEEMLGYSPEEWMGGRLWPERLHSDDRERVLAADERFEAGADERFSEEYRLIAKDGSVVWVHEEAVVLKDEGGNPLFWQGVIFDITERKEAEEALKESEVILAEAQRLAHLGSWDWDVRSGKVRWSDETFRIYGLAPQVFVPSFDKLLEVVHPEDRQSLSEHLNAALQQDGPYDFEHRIVRPDGEVRVVNRRAEVVRDENDEPLKMVGTVHDITERKALEEKLEHQALHDPLTHLPNRALFMDRLRHALSRAKRSKREVAILFMDLDNFKVINDSLGHRAGDRVLVTASKRIQSVLRPEDTVARLGGDEFILLLEGIDATAAVHASERVQERLRAPFSISGRQLFVTASVGIALGGVNGKQAADLLRDADLAMYRAKHSGKASYAVFEEGMNARALERLELEHGLRQALEREEFRVHYQPQMLLDADLQRYLRSVGSQAIVARTATQPPRISGVEALVRWEHPERGLLLPDDFVPIAEQTGLIVDIGEAVLAEACRQTKEWQARFPADPPLAVCVNLSARQFREPDLTEKVRRVLAETGIDPTCLHLEITESTAMGNAPATVATLEELKDLGVRMVIDDFGTGYSSLSYLERFPVDHVKIDRSFVSKLVEDPGAAALVSGMIRLAHSLGLKVIAEGVETEEQLERLQGLGCDLAQGHYFSEPLPGDAVGALLKTNAPGS
jgi:diguanylate cyclase (GGDEF)-like protein/PAS domain S-box-containing protein